MLFRFLCLVVLAQQSVVGMQWPQEIITISMTDDYGTIKRSVERVFAQQRVTNVSYEADVHIDSDEFCYLIGFKRGDSVSPQDLIRACVYLQKKHKFSLIEVVLTTNLDGADLTFRLHGSWTFNKVKFEGVLLGKDTYRHYYLLEPGEVFDPAKHKHSLVSIRKAFAKDGYLNAHVYDYLDYDKQNRCVTVHVVLEPRDCYVVQKVDLEAEVELPSMQEDADAVLAQLKTVFIPRIAHQYYQEELINKQTAFLKDYLVKRGFFSVAVQLKQEVDHEENTLHLTFTIKFNQKRFIEFSGNTFFSDRDLYSHVELFGSSLSIIPVSLIQEEIERLYVTKGFWDIAIEVIAKNESYHLKIHEGHRAVINELYLHGVRTFKSHILREQFFFRCLHKGYDEKLLDENLDRLITFYQKEGFWDFAVVSKQLKKQAEGTYFLEIVVDEGHRRFLKGVCVEQYPYLLKSKQFLCLTTKCGQPFDVMFLHEQKRLITKYFHDKGHVYVQVKHHFEEDPVGHITVRWEVDALNATIRFGKTVIVGKSTIPFKYIQKELCYCEGQPWNIDQVEATISNLRRIGIHEAIFVYPEPIGNSDEEKAVILKLVEDDPFEIRVRAGFQQVSRSLTFRSGTTYKLGGSVLYKNPLHVGDTFSTDVDVSKFYRNLTFEYHRPWFFGKRVGWSLKGYTIKYIQPVKIGSKKPLYQATQRGLLLFFGRRFTQVNWGFNVGMEYMETNGLSVELAEAINFAPVLIDKKIPYVFIEPTVLLDFLDDNLNPSYGSLTVMSGKGMFPWKPNATTFFKLLFEESVFYPVWRAVVLGCRLRFGHIFQNKFPNIMPPERFYLGGENSLRGYDYDSVPPLGTFIDEDGKKQFVPHGGKSMVNLNFELRIPLFTSFSGVIFQDFGTLIERNFAEIKGDRLFAATGFGVRYHTPIGPLRFDIGFKWKKRYPSDSIYAWFLTLGHAF